jgi:GTP-binding protein
MEITNAEFIVSNTQYKKCPKPEVPEFAFIGRSNVGKSSLINTLVNKPGLAKTSSRPGKTQLINHFSINNKLWYLVDLPGYGYARVSKSSRAKWADMIDGYLLNRKNLICTFVLIDSRIDPQHNDLDFIHWLGTNGVPFVLVFTKIDKLSGSELPRQIEKYKKKLKEEWEELPRIFATSAKHLKGKNEILGFIEENVMNFTEIPE